MILRLTETPIANGRVKRPPEISAGQSAKALFNMDSPAFDQLRIWAADEVRRTLAALPVRLRETACALPVMFEALPSDELLADGLDADVLGLFVGGDHNQEEHALLPPQIILYLENIWLMIEEEDGGEEEFRLEVRTTLLHELGHYLGLDEDDLIERGLE